MLRLTDFMMLRPFFHRYRTRVLQGSSRLEKPPFFVKQVKTPPLLQAKRQEEDLQP